MRLLISMTRQVRRAALVALAAATVTTGCTQSTAGNASPGVEVVGTPTSTPTTARSAPRPTTSRPGSTGPLAGTSPCDLVTAQDRAQLGFKSKPEEGRLAYARHCSFDEAGFLASVAIFDTLGPDKQVDGARERRPVPTVGRHRAEQWLAAAGGCSVSLTVSASSTVDAFGTDVDGNEQRSCEIAMKLAQLVEPKLP